MNPYNSSNSSSHQIHSHRLYSLTNLKDFLIVGPYSRKLLHTLDFFPYEPTSYKLHLVSASHQHLLGYNTLDQRVYKILQRTTCETIVFLSFCVSRKRTCSYKVCSCLFNLFYSKTHLDQGEDFLNHPTPFSRGKEWLYLLLNLCIFYRAFRSSGALRRSVLF